MASRRSCHQASFWLVTTTVMVVLRVPPPGGDGDAAMGRLAARRAIQSLISPQSSGVGPGQRATLPSRSTMAPKALTTVKTMTFVGPEARAAAPWPEYVARPK